MKITFNSTQELRNAVDNNTPTINPAQVTKAQIDYRKYSVLVGADGNGTVIPELNPFQRPLGNPREAQEIQRILFPSPVAMGVARQFPSDANLEPSAPLDNPAPQPPPPYDSLPPSYEAPPSYHAEGGGLFRQAPDGRFIPLDGGEPVEGMVGRAIGSAAGGGPLESGPLRIPMSINTPPTSAAALVTSLISQPRLFDITTPGIFGAQLSIASGLLLSGRTVDNNDDGLEVAAGLCTRLSQAREVREAGFTCSLAVISPAHTQGGSVQSMCRLVSQDQYDSVSPGSINHCYLLLENNSGEKLIIDPSAGWWAKRDTLCFCTPAMLQAEMETLFGHRTPGSFRFNSSVFGLHNMDDCYPINRAIFDDHGAKKEQVAKAAAKLLFRAWYGANMLP